MSDLFGNHIVGFPRGGSNKVMNKRTGAIGLTCYKSSSVLRYTEVEQGTEV